MEIPPAFSVLCSCIVPTVLHLRIVAKIQEVYKNLETSSDRITEEYQNGMVEGFSDEYMPHGFC